MDELAKYLAVFLGGMTGIWKAIPIGIAFKMSSITMGLLIAAGASTSILVLFFAGDRFRNWIISKYNPDKIDKRKGRFLKWMDRFGVAGLGLLVTGPFGPFVPLILGVLFVENKRRFLIFLLIGTFIWSIILSYLFVPLVELTTKLFT